MLILQVLLFLAPAILSVLFGWWSWRSAPSQFSPPTWRIRSALWGLIAATAGVILESTFLIREYAFSYLSIGPLHDLWQLLAWTAVLTWVISIVAALFGKGRLRWALFLYVLTSIMGCYLFIALHD